MTAAARPVPQDHLRKVAAPAADDVFDADAARAARREASGADFPFRWGGQVFTIPPAKEWPLDVTGVLASGDLVSAMRLLLDDQYEAFVDVQRPALGDVEAILGAVAKQQGITLPQ